MYKLILSLVIISCLACAEMDGNRFYDKVAGFEITAPDGSWSYDLSRRGKKIVFLKNDGITEVLVETQPLQNNQKDSLDVARDQNISYDGWQYVAGRKLDWHELKGAQNAFTAMYSKIILRRVSSNSKIIVQEGYFVKDRQVYIVTLVTDSEKWNDVKNELLRAWNSFRIY